MEYSFTKEQLEEKLGEAVKTLRLLKNIDRKTLCVYAGISVNALRHLENGKGASIKTLIAIAQSLNKTDWILSLAPEVSINPLTMVRGKQRKRARSSSLMAKNDLNHKQQLLKSYGLTIDDFIKMHKFQEGRCGNQGCKTMLNLKDRSTHVDHNHSTGKVRSLMCSGCNSALGLLREDKERVLGLVNYIKKHND